MIQNGNNLQDDEIAGLAYYKEGSLHMKLETEKPLSSCSGIHPETNSDKNKTPNVLMTVRPIIPKSSQNFKKNAKFEEGALNSAQMTRRGKNQSQEVQTSVTPKQINLKNISRGKKKNFNITIMDSTAKYTEPKLAHAHSAKKSLYFDNHTAIEDYTPQLKNHIFNLSKLYNDSLAPEDLMSNFRKKSLIRSRSNSFYPEQEDALMDQVGIERSKSINYLQRKVSEDEKNARVSEILNKRTEDNFSEEDKNSSSLSNFREKEDKPNRPEMNNLKRSLNEVIRIEGISDLKEFNFSESETRRYTSKNIKGAKAFFKFRYISQKLIDSQLSKHTKHVEAEDTENHIVFSADDRDVIKFTCLFLQKMEKAIFLFNMKKFEESFNHLTECNIIESSEEFGEVLLVFTGFDKFIVGEFLAKEKSPNLKFQVTNAFIRKMNMVDQFFLDSFRYLLSRLNLPKDSSLILTIIDVFSSIYFEDNCEGKQDPDFQDVTAVYLLASTVLAINTMFHVKDIKNIQVIKKEDFVKMNNNVKKELSEKVYDEVKKCKLDMVHDYNELIYKRLEVKSEDVLGVTGKINKGEGQNHYMSSMQNQCNQVASSNHTEKEGNGINAEECMRLLKKGEIFLKYGRNGKPHERMVYLSKDEKKLYYKSLTCSCFISEKSIQTDKLVNVYIGTDNSQTFKKYTIPPDYVQNCFSIISSGRSLDLRNEDSFVCKKWYQALKYLMKRVKSVSEVRKKKLKELSNRKEIISDFWRTEILPNWHQYRKFLLFRGNLSSQNVFFSNNELYKKKKENISQILKENKTSMKIEEKDKENVAYLWTLGIPDWLRKKMWPLVISNDLDINENLFNHFCKNIEQMEFQGSQLIDKGNMDQQTPGQETNEVVGYLHGIPIIENNNMLQESNLNVDDPVLSEIIVDIHKCYKVFKEAVRVCNIEVNEFKEGLFKIIKVFANYRPDIQYCRQISFIATIFYLTSADYFMAFSLLSNLVVSSCLLKFFLREEIHIKTRKDFFDNLLQTHCSEVKGHFGNLDISAGLFFYDWIEYLYSKTFKLETLLRIWDCYFAKGEIFLYEVALAIIKLQEKDLLNSPVKIILSSLNTFPDKFNEDDLFQEIDNLDVRFLNPQINNEYQEFLEQDKLAKEKVTLYEAYLYN